MIEPRENTSENFFDEKFSYPYNTELIIEKFDSLVHNFFADNISETKTSTRINKDNSEFNILIVEDDLTNQQVTSSILENLGYNFQIAKDGIEAIEMVLENNFDLILMDCQMPGMDGFETTTRIREIEKEKSLDNIPIVALTANAFSDDEGKCVSSGMNDYLSKPVILNNVKTKLNKWLNEKDPLINNQDDFVEVEEIDSIEDFFTRLQLKMSFSKKLLLERIGADEELLSKIVSIYLNEIPIKLKNLQESLKSKDYSTTKKLLHTIKGSSANICAEKIESIAREFENRMKKEDYSQNETMISLLLDAFEELKKVIQV